MSRDGDSKEAKTDRSAAVPVGAVVVVVAVVAAAWLAAGSVGLMAHPLRHALSWVALAVAILAGWPRPDRPPGRSQGYGDAATMARWLGLVVGVGLGLIMTAANSPVVNVLAVTVVAAALVRLQAGLAARAILIAVLATAVLAIFRLACTSIPVVWWAADALGGTLGRLAGTILWALGWLAGTTLSKPLWSGATFGGVDFLVLMAALYAGWLAYTAPPRLPRAIYAAAAILLGHLTYLGVLAFSGDIVAALPDVVPPPESANSRLGVWAWGNAARTLLPWNLPVVAGLIHAAIAAAMFRWAAWLPAAGADPDRSTRRPEKKGPPLLVDALRNFGPAALAVAMALATVLGLSRSDLSGKTIVAYAQGYLNWDKPEYDTPSTGMYGMLEPFVQSLGGRFFKSTDLAEQDLHRADVLLIVHPIDDWSKQQPALERVWEFVRRGGSLLVAAGPKIRREDAQRSVNELLRPTAMRVRYDTAVAETANWEGACQVMAHPAAVGIEDGRNQFGLDATSSIDLRPPAWPILIGRFGWSEPGSDAVRTGAATYDPGEKLGDLVLAAQQRIGRGSVVLLGDPSSLHNDLIAHSYVFAGRLFGYLAGRAASPQAWWRQMLGLLAAAAWVGLLAWWATPGRTGVAAVVLAGSLVGCLAITHRTARVLPGGSGQPARQQPRVACVDGSHLEAYSSDAWSDFGIGGFTRTLMRSGSLPLVLPQLSAERLAQAELLISIGPARQFSRAERKAVRDFVESGGTFIGMAGADKAGGIRNLLAEFDFRVPPSPVPPWSDAREPQPLGSFPLRIKRQGAEVPLRFFAAWEVQCAAKDGWNAWALWSDGEGQRPLIMSRRVERGHVAVIGDTYFATNQNLESATNVMPENVTFWRWFLTCVTDREEWLPGKPVRKTETPPEASAPEAPKNDTASDEVGP